MHAINRYEVFAVSDEFLEIIKELPEASTARAVEIGGRRIEGAKRVLLVNSVQELERNLPTIIAQLADPKRYHLRVVHRKGECLSCSNHEGEILADCPNFQFAITVNTSWEVDIPEYLSPVRMN